MVLPYMWNLKKNKFSSSSTFCIKGLWKRKPRLDWQIPGTKVVPSSHIETQITLLYLESLQSLNSCSTHAFSQPLPKAHHQLMSWHLLAIPEGERFTEEKKSFPRRRCRVELGNNDGRLSEPSPRHQTLEVKVRFEAERTEKPSEQQGQDPQVCLKWNLKSNTRTLLCLVLKMWSCVCDSGHPW